MLAALVVLALNVSAEPPKDKEFFAEAKKELKQLEGKWKFADVDKTAGEKLKEAYCEFKGTEFRMGSGNTSDTLQTVALDASTDPRCIDFVEKRDGKADRTIEGIYKLEGDTLRIALAVPKDNIRNRPTSFEKPGERTIVLTFKRVKE